VTKSLQAELMTVHASAFLASVAIVAAMNGLFVENRVYRPLHDSEQLVRFEMFCSDSNWVPGCLYMPPVPVLLQPM
jgi:hypothetical protein